MDHADNAQLYISYCAYQKAMVGQMIGELKAIEVADEGFDEEIAEEPPSATSKKPQNPK